MKNLHGEIKMSINAKVNDLIQEISKLSKLQPNEFKIFRQGKELVFADYASKTIGHLPLLSDKEKRFLLNCSCDTSLEWLRRQIYEGGVNINCQDRVSIPFNYYYFIHIYYCFIMINFCLFVYFVCIVH